MLKRWVCGVCAAVLLSAWGLALPGCNDKPPAGDQPTAATRRIGEPVSGPTPYFTIVNGQRVYYASQEDLKYALAQGR